MTIIKFSDMIQHTDVPLPKDKIQDLTLALNKFSMEHHWFRSAWLITASLSLDIQFFLILFNWLRKGFSLRIIIALIAFYGIRAVLQSIFILPFPEHIYWENPGFPWFLNIYGSRQSDFFYSGHIGFSLLWTIENFNIGSKKSGIFGIITTIMQGITLVTFRVHYSIDLFTGLVMAHYCFYWAGFISDWVDKKVLNKRILDLGLKNEVDVL